MRDIIKLLVVGIIFTIVPQALAEEYKVLVVPDNIVTENIAVDSFIYNATSEFFADDVITLLNNTDYINAPTVSETRNLLKQDAGGMISARNLTNKFRTTYNVDYITLKKIANKTDSKYVLLITSYIDAENYVLRRTLWDVLNIPGATVVDPAYKISTYAVLVDAEKNSKLWSDTFYKTISVCENRILSKGPSPQTEQLQKIKDYSKYLSPQIAQNIQLNVLPKSVYESETTQIDYGMGDIDNVFTKKYRHINKETNKIYQKRKEDCLDLVDDTKTKINQIKESYKAKKAEKLQKEQEEIESKLEVKATPVYEEEIIKENENNITEISNKSEKVKENKFNSIKNAIFKKETEDIQYPELIELEIKKKKKNNLYGDYQISQPELRDYN